MAFEASLGLIPAFQRSDGLSGNHVPFAVLLLPYKSFKNEGTNQKGMEEASQELKKTFSLRIGVGLSALAPCTYQVINFA